MSTEHRPDDRPDGERSGAASRVSRRRFLQASGATVAAVGGGMAVAGPAQAKPSATADALRPRPGHGSRPSVAQPGRGRPIPIPRELSATPIRPPAAPLIVRQPYLSTWLPATALPGTWQTFWAGAVTAIGGIAQIDGASYMFAGAPTIVLDVPNGGQPPQTTVSGFEAAMDQTGLEVTATRSVFSLQGGGVQLTVEFLSPVEPGDLRRQSVPMAYVLASAQSVDGSAHSVSLYLDISGEWVSGDRSQQFTWAPSTVPSPAGTLQVWSLQLANPQPLVEVNQQAQWGTVVWATPQTSGLTWQSGSSPDVRAQFVDHGVLTDTNDTSFTAIDGDGFPVFAFALDLGRVGSQSHSAQFSIGQVRTPAVSFLGTELQPLWTTYWSDWQQMLGFFHADRAAASRRADALDARISHDARALGGTEYEGLCVLSLRQAYGGTELVAGPDGSPWAFLKEISSDGDTSTVDVLFPAFPVWVYLDPQYLALLLAPLFAYPESGQWTAAWAPHDLGPYPTATGYPGNGGENMPVEESGNMLIMASAYAQAAPGPESTAYLRAHYATLRGWAEYLVANLPDPGFQNQTDDFAGLIAHSVNLALKGIVGVAAMSQIADVLGNAVDASRYSSLAKGFIATWLQRAQDPSGAHLDLTYNGAGGGDGTWGTTYNGFADTLLGTDLVPEAVRAEQAAFYPKVSNLFGLPLQVPHSYAKTDWELWTAAWLHAYPIRDELIAREYLYANTTPSRVPFGDLYDTISGENNGFEARPVQGGIFSLLALGELQGRRADDARRAPRSKRLRR
jgi:hypothetical protein